MVFGPFFGVVQTVLHGKAENFRTAARPAIGPIPTVLKSANGFKLDISFIPHFLASHVMHPHKMVANHGELARRTERQPYMDCHGRTQNIINIGFSQKKCFPASWRR
jgi:hypothetical protein